MALPRSTTLSLCTPVVLAGLWVAALFWAPYAAARTAPGSPAFRLATGVYLTGSLVCHQRAGRSFHLWGTQLPVCARCAGLYLLVPLGAVSACLLRRRVVPGGGAEAVRWRYLLAVALVPTAATVLLEWTGVAAMTNTARAAAALPLGAAVGWIVEAAVVEWTAGRAVSPPLRKAAGPALPGSP